MARSWQSAYWIFGYFLSLLALVWVLCYFRQNVLAGYQVEPISTSAVPVDSVSLGAAESGTTLEQRRWQDGLAAKKSLAAGESKSAPRRHQPPALVWFGFGFPRVIIAAITLWTVIYAMAFFALQGVLRTRMRQRGTPPEQLP